MKVAIVSIMKNESKHIARWADSAKDADYRVLLDTGSDDDSVALARACGVTVHEAKIVPWHFGNARNHLLDLLPDDIDWIINLDVDEVLGDGWRAHLEAVPNDGSVNRARYTYTWNWEEYIHSEDGSIDIQGTIARGKPGLIYQGDKITRRFSHRWMNAVHEVNITQSGHQELQGQCGLRIYHFADNTKSRSSYLPLLLLDVEENPDNDRNVYYCARELMFYGRTQESVEMFKRHLLMPSSVWAPERAFSMRYIAKQSPEEREKWLLRGCGEYPWGRELWVDLAQHYYDIGHWEGCYFAASRALSLTNRGDLYLTEAVMWGWLPHDLLAIAAHRLGRHQIALEHGYKALGHAPHDKRLSDNMFFYKNAVSMADVVIPTKDNIAGLRRVVNQLLQDQKVDNIFVICDGQEAFDRLDDINDKKVKKVMTSGEFNIHKAWNFGFNLSKTGNHVFFLNDDVYLNENCVSHLVAELDRDDSIGLICPQYSALAQDRVVTDTCRGRYDGTGGMAGFAMMLASDLTDYRFPEELQLWWGDDHLVDHVVDKGRKCLITSKARCVHEHSVTINKVPNDELARIVNLDKEKYDQQKRAR
jgi:glycosyltransferase involved in cell wall biosynthesis